MIGFIGRRLLEMLFAAFIGVSIVFWIFTVTPGDPARLAAGEQASEEYVQQLQHEFGLDKALLPRYVDFLRGILKGDLGKSYFTNTPVIQELFPRILNTMKLAIPTVFIAITTGLSIGIVAVVKKGTFLEQASKIFVLCGISIPTFTLGIVLIYVFSLYLHILPTARMIGLKSYIMPSIVLATFPSAFIARMTRSFLLEVESEDYMRTAHSKGLPAYKVTLKHGLRNALIPLITIIGMRFGYMLAGGVVVESLFAWPGMGQLVVRAISLRDFPLVRAAVLYIVLIFLTINLITDLTYAVINPKVRYV